MVKLIFDKEQIIYIGDIHGEFRTIMNKIITHKIENALIILLGDVGLGFHKKKYYAAEFFRMSKQLTKHNNTMIMIRGNHDDPSYYNDNFWFKNIYPISDYSTIECCGESILTIGGGISVDRTERDMNASEYWIDEFIKQPPKDLNQETTIVVSHMAVGFVEPVLKNNIEYWMERDVNVQEDDEKQRKLLTSINNRLPNLKKWCYGHYHQSFYTNVDGVEYIGLEINEIKG